MTEINDQSQTVTPAVSLRLEIMKKRADFVAASKAARRGTQGMIVQARRREDDLGARVGFTCSKRVGNAVARNRAKRRLRAVARDVLPRLGRDGWDYVLIGREGGTAARDFTDLIGDLEYALRKLHKAADG
jgi:ribonuclease P protein component